MICWLASAAGLRKRVGVVSLNPLGLGALVCALGVARDWDVRHPLDDNLDILGTMLVSESLRTAARCVSAGGMRQYLPLLCHETASKSWAILSAMSRRKYVPVKRRKVTTVYCG